MRYWTHELLVPIDFSPTEFLVMRHITSDELGLLKEIVTELCRRREDVDAGPTSSSSSSIATEFAGSRLPAVQRLDLSSRADSSGDFGSDNNSSSIPGRSAGIVSLASIPPPPPSSSEASCFNFAALCSNGIVETWRGTRRKRTKADITPVSYVKGDSLINGVVGRTTDGGDKTPETSVLFLWGVVYQSTKYSHWYGIFLHYQ